MRGLRDLPKDLFDLKNKIVVVTGGTGILGSLYCRSMAQAGARVIIADLDLDECNSLAQEISAQTDQLCRGLAVDLSKEISVQDWAGKILDEFGSIDVLVNNAAAKSPNFFAHMQSRITKKISNSQQAWSPDKRGTDFCF